MCGIYAAVNANTVTEHLLSGLSALTYRGYDSAGIAVVTDGKIERCRASGKLDALSEALKAQPLDGGIGIAHTRWATHGLPTVRNAHPHMTPRVAVAHNGIVENYATLREKLEGKGYIFETETDSETIAQLITFYLDTGLNHDNALRQTLMEIKGSFGIVVIFRDNEQELFAARKGSPLIIGKGENGFYVSSDVNAFDQQVHSATHMRDGDIARLTQSSFEVFDNKGRRIHRFLSKINRETESSSKNGYHHYMRKEIDEQPQVFDRTCQHYFSLQTYNFQLPKFPVNIEKLERISIVACGTSYYSSLIGKYWIESLANISVDVDIASEYRYRSTPFSRNSVSIFVSQSGETADTLAAMEYAKSAKHPCISMVNVLTSTMANNSSTVLPTLAGPEIGVASTKAFISQLTTFLILALVLKRERSHDRSLNQIDLQNEIARFSRVMEAYLRDTVSLEKTAHSLSEAQSVLYIGRGTSYPLAEEGALKLKEISYIHAEAYPAGELKHGPLALVDDTMPVIVIAPPDSLFNKTLSNLREVASRGGKITLISDENGVSQSSSFIENSIAMPKVHPLLTPLLYALPLQLLAYHVALIKGCDVDQPRNLAKSVTVE